MNIDQALAAVFMQARSSYNDRHGKTKGRVEVSLEAAKQDVESYKQDLRDRKTSTLAFAL